MPTPENREDRHRFIGMMSYLSQFIPHFAEKAYTLRGLLKKDVPCMWDVDHQKRFDELKHAVSSRACLQYYDPTAPVQLEVDASGKGLGIVLVENGRPVAFGSKTLTECQSRYSNFEREILKDGILRDPVLNAFKVKDRVCFAPVFIPYNTLYMYIASICCKTSVTPVLYH